MHEAPEGQASEVRKLEEEIELCPATSYHQREPDAPQQSEAKATAGHTPGPWYTSFQKPGQHIIGAGNRWVARLFHPQAEMFGRTFPGLTSLAPSPEEAAANAALIAQAPDLQAKVDWWKKHAEGWRMLHDNYETENADLQAEVEGLKQQPPGRSREEADEEFRYELGRYGPPPQAQQPDAEATAGAANAAWQATVAAAQVFEGPRHAFIQGYIGAASGVHDLQAELRMAQSDKEAAERKVDALQKAESDRDFWKKRYQEQITILENLDPRMDGTEELRMAQSDKEAAEGERDALREALHEFHNEVTAQDRRLGSAGCQDCAARTALAPKEATE